MIVYSTVIWRQDFRSIPHRIHGSIFNQCHTEKSSGLVTSPNLRQRSIQEEENSKKQKESSQEDLLANLASSAREQIQNQVEKDLEPKLDILLAQKVEPQETQKKESIAKKERNVEFRSISYNTNAARQQSKRSDLTIL